MDDNRDKSEQELLDELDFDLDDDGLNDNDASAVDAQEAAQEVDGSDAEEVEVEEVVVEEEEEEVVEEEVTDAGGAGDKTDPYLTNNDISDERARIVAEQYQEPSKMDAIKNKIGGFQEFAKSKLPESKVAKTCCGAAIVGLIAGSYALSNSDLLNSPSVAINNVPAKSSNQKKAVAPAALAKTVSHQVEEHNAQVEKLRSLEKNMLSLSHQLNQYASEVEDNNSKIKQLLNTVHTNNDIQQSLSSDLTRLRQSQNVQVSALSDLKNSLTAMSTKGEFNAKDIARLLTDVTKLEHRSTVNSTAINSLKSTVSVDLKNVKGIVSQYADKVNGLDQKVTNATYITSVPNRVDYKKNGISLTTTSDYSKQYGAPKKSINPNLASAKTNTANGKYILANEWTLTGTVGNYFNLKDSSGGTYQFTIGSDLDYWGQITDFVDGDYPRLITSKGYVITNKRGRQQWQM
ncbi:hypothetical protein V6259_12490 [Marinomonas sp. TI.3.20]|uniref:hypothetical protein n=1 Tax=Marinomonas sp. TI.3.20 TaxID=3121296 RepID=UPI00311E5FE2